MWPVKGCMKHGNIVWTVCRYFIGNVAVPYSSLCWEVTWCMKHGNIVWTMCRYFIANVTGHRVHETWKYCMNNVSIFHSQCDCSGLKSLLRGHRVHETWEYGMNNVSIFHSQCDWSQGAWRSKVCKIPILMFSGITFCDMVGYPKLVTPSRLPQVGCPK